MKPIFFDEAKIHVQGGTGGNGCMSFRREKYVPLGGPDGGNGGPGGSVYLVTDPHLNTLIAFKRRQRFSAEAGDHGSSKGKQGKAGDDLLIPVPMGTMVYPAESGELLGDLKEPGQRLLVAQGGRGGRGNAFFATPTNRAPRLAEKGEPGQERWLYLELRLIADVGIVGCPNAGKSTLLSRVSAARPKIAPYPFTTLAPNLGVATIDEHSFVLADIPGLIEGAHKGLGLGHGFLRHIARTRLLIHLLDGAAEDPLLEFAQINEELRLYDPKLAEKPQLVALNKMDLAEAQKWWPKVKREMERRGFSATSISALTGEGVRELLYKVSQALESLPEEEPVEEIEVFRLPEEEESFRILREGKAFRVQGHKVERAVAMTEWGQEEAVRRFQRVLEAMGVSAALESAGVKTGDIVRIGDMELEWV